MTGSIGVGTLHLRKLWHNDKLVVGASCEKRDLGVVAQCHT